MRTCDREEAHHLRVRLHDMKQSQGFVEIAQVLIAGGRHSWQHCRPGPCFVRQSARMQHKVWPVK